MPSQTRSHPILLIFRPEGAKSGLNAWHRSVVQLGRDGIRDGFPCQSLGLEVTFSACFAEGLPQNLQVEHLRRQADADPAPAPEARARATLSFIPASCQVARHIPQTAARAA